ncbi:MAG: DUF1850 domain-containing protein [Deltaproteobacteria bacterium]|nr:DUF1850 domain-containing protein [Deltaproteobacteria bacterium]
MGIRARRTWWVLGGLILLTTTIYLFQQVPCLVVGSQGSSRELLILPLEPPQEFTLQFLHSYDRGFVWEHYTIEPDLRIYLTGMTLQSFLGGQGFVEGDLTIEDGLGKIRRIRRLLDKLSFFLGDIADHRLVLPQGAYPLQQFASSGEIIEIRGEKKVRGQILFNQYLKWIQRSWKINERPQS